MIFGAREENQPPTNMRSLQVVLFVANLAFVSALRLPSATVGAPATSSRRLTRSYSRFCILLRSGKLVEARALRDAIIRANNMFEGDAFHIAPAVVQTFIPEEPKKDSSELGLEGARELASQRVESAAPKGDVSWLSSVIADDFLSLTAWNTPQVQVPHFFWAAAVTEDGTSLELTLDFPPRADAGYDTALPDGSFPEPDSREAFAKSSTRKELADLYFGAEATDFVKTLQASPGAAPRAGTSSVPANVQLAAQVGRGPAAGRGRHRDRAGRAGAVALWLQWMAAEKLDQRRTMMVFAHDSKVRAACLRARSCAHRVTALRTAAASRWPTRDRSTSRTAARRRTRRRQPILTTVRRMRVRRT